MMFGLGLEGLSRAFHSQIAKSGKVSSGKEKSGQERSIQEVSGQERFYRKCKVRKQHVTK